MDAPLTRLVLVRHGQTASNASGRFQGHQDIPLNRVGRAQADAVADRLAAMRPARVVASDLGRAQQTAQVIASASGLDVETDPRLREIDVGSWSGQTVAAIAEANPWFHDALAAGEDFRRSDTGETATEAGERVAGVLRELAHRHAGETTVVVGHGLSLRVGLSLVTGLGFAGSFALVGLWNCSWTILEPGDRWRILTYNSVVPARDS